MDTITTGIATLSVGQPVSIPGEAGAWVIDAITDAGESHGAGLHVTQGGHKRGVWAKRAVPITEATPVVGTAWLALDGEVWRLGAYETFNWITQEATALPEYRVMALDGTVFISRDSLPADAARIYTPEVPA